MRLHYLECLKKSLAIKNWDGEVGWSYIHGLIENTFDFVKNMDMSVNGHKNHISSILDECFGKDTQILISLDVPLVHLFVCKGCGSFCKGEKERALGVT